MRIPRLLLPAAWILLVSQLVHTLVAIVAGPGDDESASGEGVVGLPLGLLAIIANIVAIVALRRGRSWAPNLAVLTGGSVAIGFVLYHGLPAHSWATNPYWGSAGVVDWASVVFCVAAGALCVWAGWPVTRSQPERATV